MLSIWYLLRLIPWVFWFEIFTRHFLLCVLSCGWDLSLKFVPQDLQDLWNFSLVSVILFWVHITLKNSENTYTSIFICCLYPVKEACPKIKYRKRYKEEKPWRFFWKKEFSRFFALGLVLITPYSLGVLNRNFHHTFLIMCIGLWLKFEPQIRSTRFAINFLFIIATTERKVRFYVKLFDHFLTQYSFVWAEVCRISTQLLLGFFHNISIRHYFRKLFKNVLHSKPLLFRYFQNYALVSTILLWVHITQKSFENT